MSGRGIFRMIWNDFINSLRPRPKSKVVGVDLNGTKYFETIGRTTRGRYFEPIDKEDHLVDIPNEWESWLRYRRHDPPTVEEIEKRILLDKMRKENALKIQQQQPVKEIDKNLLKREESGYRSFPNYNDEYQK